MAHLREYVGTGKLSDKKALIACGSSQLGRSIAILMAKEGADLTIIHLPEEKEDAEDTKRLVELEGRPCHLFSAHLTSRDSCRKAIKAHMKKHKQLNVLVNNASYQPTCKGQARTNIHGMSEVFQSNMIQLIALTNHALPYMSRDDSIINATSVEAFAKSDALMDYAATKGAVAGLTMSLAVQLSLKGIRVNAVVPGPLYTTIQVDKKVDEIVKTAVLKAPNLHTIRTSEIAANFIFLASDEASLYNGQVVHSYSIIARSRKTVYHSVS